MAETNLEETQAKTREMEKQTRAAAAARSNFASAKRRLSFTARPLSRQLYYDQWTRLLDAVPQLRTFLAKTRRRQSSSSKRSSMPPNQRTDGPESSGFKVVLRRK